MINGDAKEFIDGLYYGDERFFIYDGNKYFVQGYCEAETFTLELYIIENPKNDFEWHACSQDRCYLVNAFEKAKIFNGKSFWEVEKEIEWVDC